MRRVSLGPPCALGIDNEDFVFEHLEHLILLLLLLALLKNCHGCPGVIGKYSWLSVLNLLQILLDVEFLHLLLELMLVTLGGLLGQGTLTTLLSFLKVHPVYILFLGLHYAFLSLLLFSFIVGTFLEFLQFLAEPLRLMLDDMESGISVV